MEYLLNNKKCKKIFNKEIVEKTLEEPLDHLDMISGATILGNGNICLVLDVANIINTIFKEKSLIIDENMNSFFYICKEIIIINDNEHFNN